jgi:hypothetical protein
VILFHFSVCDATESMLGEAAVPDLVTEEAEETLPCVVIDELAGSAVK